MPRGSRKRKHLATSGGRPRDEEDDSSEDPDEEAGDVVLRRVQEEMGVHIRVQLGLAPPGGTLDTDVLFESWRRAHADVTFTNEYGVFKEVLSSLIQSGVVTKKARSQAHSLAPQQQVGVASDGALPYGGASGSDSRPARSGSARHLVGFFDERLAADRQQSIRASERAELRRHVKALVDAELDNDFDDNGRWDVDVAAEIERIRAANRSEILACAVCDEFGTEFKVPAHDSSVMRNMRRLLGADNFDPPLHPSLLDQYRVPGFGDMVLSPRGLIASSFEAQPSPQSNHRQNLTKSKGA